MSTSVKISARDLPAELRAHRGALRRAVQRGVRLSMQRSKALLMHRSPVDLGELKASWKISKSESQPTLMNTAPHAGIVEAGARPHPVSADGRRAIYEWVKRHFGYMRTGRAGRFTIVPKRDSLPGRVSKPRGALAQQLVDERLMGIAEAIIHKLRTKGQEPTYFVRDSLPEIRRFLQDEVQHELEVEMKRVAERRAGRGG